ncbi:hypothetical protein IMSAGC003_00524 [Lachnospiraceae bacterium]|uniref:Antirestriction protein (ArdA) n=1 Tax=Acetatifactor muris TaxID=879566 RepID=A0A2K4ZN14_9FIRM|nr:DUF6329 domain-containing protein [Acetatifactor muris]MCR2050221.1 DUF6329 domain-containing protein [Acetatifactor muris]GFH93994.1 hypothetical protein IMSAGC003_00524 [Lachnospiraceae bacterium]SOY31883.1 Antirestriction protein (ArdA) [Acetatifactor muris]
MLKVYLSNIATSEGLWLAFPMGSQERQEAMKFGAGGTNEIGAATSPLEGLKTHLEGMTLQPGQGIRELEFLDRHTDCMTEREKGIFQAALEIEKPRSVMEIVNLSCNLDKFALYEGVSSHEELGRRVLGNEEMPEKVALYLDYGAAGEKYAGSHAGCFMNLGYVVRTGEALEPLYDGKFLPQPGYDKSCVIQAWLYSPYYAAGHYRNYPVSLPASDDRLALAEEKLGWRKLDEHEVAYISCPVSELESCLPFSRDIMEMNAFAGLLAERNILGDAGTKEKLFAALEAEAPENMAEAMEIAAGLDRYTMLPEEVKTAEDYAVYYMKAEQMDIDIDADLQLFIDYKAYGEFRMRRDGVVQTEHGLVRREDIPMAQPTEELEEFRLFSPLSGLLYPYDEDYGGISDQPMEIGPGDLCQYEDKILERIGQEHLEEEGERGLAVYLGNRLLKRKVFSMNPTVEIWNGELWGVLEVKSHGTLSPQEMSGLMEEWLGQESDGWGEGFEQREIKTEEGELCVSFWHSGDDFFIKTEQELKQWQTQDFGMKMGGNG